MSLPDRANSRRLQTRQRGESTERAGSEPGTAKVDQRLRIHHGLRRRRASVGSPIGDYAFSDRSRSSSKQAAERARAI